VPGVCGADEANDEDDDDFDDDDFDDDKEDEDEEEEEEDEDDRDGCTSDSRLHHGQCCCLLSDVPKNKRLYKKYLYSR